CLSSSHWSTLCSYISATLTYFSITCSPTSDIYSLSLHDALPISYIFRAYFAMFKAAQARGKSFTRSDGLPVGAVMTFCNMLWKLDRKSTRLNSSHGSISYAVFCLKKKRQIAYSLLQLSLT